MFEVFECLVLVLFAVAGGWFVTHRMRIKSRAAQAVLAAVLACFIWTVAQKSQNNSNPYPPPQLILPKQPTGGGSGFAYLLPEWFKALKLSKWGWDGVSTIPKIWRKRTFTDSSLGADSVLDRDGDGLDDFTEFLIGSDSRSRNTSGGLCDDGYLFANGLDPSVYWDNAVWSNNLTIADMYVRGWPLDVNNLVTNHNEWLERGLEPGEDEWPEDDDWAGDLTRVSVRVTGPASRSAVVAIGPIRHVGPQAKVYTLRAGRRYDVSVYSFDGRTGLPGEVEILPVKGMVSFTEGFSHSFTLTGASLKVAGASLLPGGGMQLLNAPTGSAMLGGLDTWMLMLFSENHGCIHGRLELTVKVVKGGAGVFDAEHGTYRWQWTDKKPLGVVVNTSPGQANVLLSEKMAEVWRDEYGLCTWRELACFLTPPGGPGGVVGRAMLTYCAALALEDEEVAEEADGVDMGDPEDAGGPGNPSVPPDAGDSCCGGSGGCWCHSWRAWCGHCLNNQPGRCSYCWYPEDPEKKDKDEKEKEEEEKRKRKEERVEQVLDEEDSDSEWPVPTWRGCWFFNNNDDLALNQADFQTAFPPNLKTRTADPCVAKTRIGSPRFSGCCVCPAHNEEYKLKIHSISNGLDVFDEVGNPVPEGSEFEEWKQLYLQGSVAGGIAAPYQIVWSEEEDGTPVTNNYVVGRVSLFGDTDGNGALDMMDFWKWPREGGGCLMAQMVSTNQHPTALDVFDKAALLRFGAGVWMGAGSGGTVEMQIKGGGFEVWDTNGNTFYAKSDGASHIRPLTGDGITSYGLRCYSEGHGHLVLTYHHPNVPTNSYKASILLRGNRTRVANIKFNHDTSSSQNDAINIRYDYDTPIDVSSGEWHTNGVVNHPVCYVGLRDVTVKARFTTTYPNVTNMTISTMYAYSSFLLQPLQPLSVEFANGVSVGDVDGYVTFTASYPTFPIVYKYNDFMYWQTTAINHKPVPAVLFETTGPHRVYNILEEPKQSPWNNTYGHVNNAWVSALDFVMDKMGVRTLSDKHAVLAAITSYLHTGHGLTYDINHGVSKFIIFRDEVFNLTSYINKSSGNIVNCYDQAGGVYVLSRLLGIPSEYIFMGNRSARDVTGAIIDLNGKPPFGFINPIDLVGEGLCNNPFYPNTTGGKITSNPDETNRRIRSAFGNHAFVRYASFIFDACAGPYLGTGDLQQYATVSIDISSTLEQQYSPDGATWGGNEDGVFSTTEVDNALDLSQQPVKGIR